MAHTDVASESLNSNRRRTDPSRDGMAHTDLASEPLRSNRRRRRDPDVIQPFTQSMSAFRYDVTYKDLFSEPLRSNGRGPSPSRSR